MMKSRPNRHKKTSEEGFVLLAVMFLLALLIISMAVALPRIAASIQRDREVEAMHRGLQYRRAIQLYYRKFNRYPPNLDALVKTSEIRFLRNKYVDPTTGKPEWKPIMFGQNKTPLAMGFFGQPLAGIGTSGGVMAGTGPSGDSGITGASSLTDSSTTSSTGFSLGSSSATTSTTTETTTGTDGSTATGTSSGSTSQTFGGAGIVGVSPMSSKQSILVYKKKNHYNEWEFLYSPLSDQTTITGGNATTALSGSSTTTGTSSGSSTIGVTSTGSSSTTTTPQQ